MLGNHLPPHGRDREPRADDDLKKLGLDSMSAVNLLFDLEEHFNVTFPEHMLNERTFQNARSLEQALHALMRGMTRPNEGAE